MNIYYTVDRTGKLEAGTKLSISSDYSRCKFFPIQGVHTQSDLSLLTSELFPHGLSEHGKRYLLDDCLVFRGFTPPIPAATHNPTLELILELARRAFFPETPSRMTSVFAWETHEEAVSFLGTHGNGKIFQINAPLKGFKADMNLLKLGGSGIGAIDYAMKYWSGSSSSTPVWEHLLQGEIEIVSEIVPAPKQSDAASIR